MEKHEKSYTVVTCCRWESKVLWRNLQINHFLINYKYQKNYTSPSCIITTQVKYYERRLYIDELKKAHDLLELGAIAKSHLQKSIMDDLQGINIS